jgi:hypothetical protein
MGSILDIPFSQSGFLWLEASRIQGGTQWEESGDGFRVAAWERRFNSPRYPVLNTPSYSGSWANCG